MVNPSSLKPFEVSFHHVGIVTSDLEQTTLFYSGLGYASTAVYTDDYQKVNIQLLKCDNKPTIEIIQPHDKHSPAYSWLQRLNGGPYHTCYEVNELEKAILHFRRLGFFPTSKAYPAIVFANRRVIFLYRQVIGLIELLEKG